jgi:hypothetical protein
MNNDMIDKEEKQTEKRWMEIESRIQNRCSGGWG